MPAALRTAPATYEPDNVFNRVRVDFLVEGPARISWSLSKFMIDPAPWTFQLQRGDYGIQADDWIDVGPPLPDAFTTSDAGRKIHGTLPTTHYRVILTTPLGSYASTPTGAFADLDYREWLLARELVRKERLRHRGFTSVQGWLLKRRWSGPQLPPSATNDPAQMVLDPLTGDLIKRQTAKATLGTPFLGGYFAPTPYEIDFYLTASDPDVDAQETGNTDQPGVSQSGRGLMFPPPTRGDVFVDSRSDARYELKPVKYTAALRGVPLIADLELRLFPFGDVIYSLALP